jgi:hypothetical protein
MPPPLSRRQLNRATLARQLLLRRERTSVTDAVERLGGMQAQEPKPPFIGLWTRLEDFEPPDLRKALKERELIRATMMRATLHLMSAADYVSLRGGLQPVMTDAMRALGSRGKGLEVEKVTPAARVLLEKEPRNFDELRGLLQEQFPEVNDRALGYATRMHLPLAMVPTDDRWAFPAKADFTLAEEWLGNTLAEPDPAALVVRYLGAFGPASPTDFQTWCGLKGFKVVFETLDDRLETFEDERGRTLFDLPGAPRPDEDEPAPPRFLPEFDNLMLAHSDRTRVIADEHKPEVVTKNLRVRATFLWDGFAAGTWKAERKKTKATLHLSPFAKLSGRAVNELSEEGTRLLALLEPDAPTHEIKVNSPQG